MIKTRVGEQIGKVLGSRCGLRWLAMGIGALCLLGGASALRAEVIMSTRAVDLGEFFTISLGIGGSTDETHRQIAVGLTVKDTPMMFEYMAPWIINPNAENIALIGGIYSDLDGKPNTQQAAFEPFDILSGSEPFPVTLTTATPFILAANTTYWFVVDGETIPVHDHQLGWLGPVDPADPLAPTTDYYPFTSSHVTYVNEVESLNSGAHWRNLNEGWVAFSINASPVPEPSTYALAIVGLLGGIILLRRRRA